MAPGYFRAIGIPLVRGRDFTAADDAGAPHVAIVSELFAQLYLGGRDPIGARVSLSEGKEPWFTIVGVVGDIRQSGPADTPIQAVYVPLRAIGGHVLRAHAVAGRRRRRSTRTRWRRACATRCGGSIRRCRCSTCRGSTICADARWPSRAFARS